MTKKLETLLYILVFALGISLGFAAALYISPDKAEDKLTQSSSAVMNVSSNDTSESTTSSTQSASSTIEETPQNTKNETVKATAPDTVFTVLLKVTKEGGDFLVNEGYIKVSKGYAQAPLKAYIEDYSINVNEGNAYGMVECRFIWVRENSKNELLNTGYFEEVNYG